MPKVSISKAVSCPRQEAFDRVCKILESAADLKNLDGQYKFTPNRSDFSGEASGKQFNAKLRVEENSGKSLITIDVDLPFHLGLIKGVVKSQLEDKLTQAFS